MTAIDRADYPDADYACPVLPSLNLDETEAWYVRLGFARLGRWEGYLMLGRGPLELHFWECQDRAICEASGAYLQVRDVDAYDTAWRPHVSAPARIGPLENKPWGMREFPLWDAHGNLFRVGSPIQSG